MSLARVVNFYQATTASAKVVMTADSPLIQGNYVTGPSNLGSCVIINHPRVARNTDNIKHLNTLKLYSVNLRNVYASALCSTSTAGSTRSCRSLL